MTTFLTVHLCDAVLGPWEETVSSLCTLGELRRIVWKRSGEATDVTVKLVRQKDGVELRLDNERLVSVGVENGCQVLCAYV